MHFCLQNLCGTTRVDSTVGMGCTSSKADKKPARDKQKASQEPTATSASTGTGATGTRGNDEKEAGPNSGRQEAVEENSDSGQEGDGYGEAFRTSKNGDLPWVGKGPLEGSEERSRAKKGEKDAEIDSSLSEKAYSHEQAPSPTGPNVHNEPATGEEHMMASEGSPVGNESDRQEYSKQEEVREETAKQTGATSLPAIDQTMAEEATAADALADLDELAEDDGGALSEEISKAHAASEAAVRQALWACQRLCVCEVEQLIGFCLKTRKRRRESPMGEKEC